MEKLASKYYNLVQKFGLLSLLIFGFSNNILAQERVPLNQTKQYFIKNIKVSGKIKYNEQTVTTFTGLEKGQAINVPGEEISNAVKKLWKLGLFSDVDFYIDAIEGDSIALELYINELPKLNDLRFLGVRKGKVDALIKDNNLTSGKIVNENLITTTKNYIENKYKKDGYYNAKVAISTKPDSTENLVNMTIRVDKGDKVKVKEIVVEGNSLIKDKKIKKYMKNTKTQFPGRFWKGSKYIKDKYAEDLTKIIEKYKEKGFRDARIVKDTIIFNKEKNNISIKLNIEEGKKYYFGDIKFLGNTIYSDQVLARELGLKKGDVFNGVLLQKRIADNTKPDGEDLTNLYQNNGYLFSTINPVEVRTEKDTIDMEIRITEGPLAYFNKISVVGNDKTNDKVIYRELLTKPGDVYSKELVVGTIRELGQLGYFDPEALEPKFENVDPSAGTVDIKYSVVEKGASQIELQGGYGGGGFIGTLGLSFNNFSMRNIFNKKAYAPLPMGDGQKVSLRLQVSQFFKNYSFSFAEPWFGGKKPIQFNSSISFSTNYQADQNLRPDKNQSFGLFSANVGISKRLTVPDRNFYLSHSISYQLYSLKNFSFDGIGFNNGASNSLAYQVGLTRTNKGVNPIFPIYGSEFSVTAKFTPPYSLFSKTDYKNLENLAENKITANASQVKQIDANGNPVKIGDYIDANGNKVANYLDAATDRTKVNAIKFNWLEYYKVKFKAEWFTSLPYKFVFRSLAEFGYLGSYNQYKGTSFENPNKGIVPFERFTLGGSGMANFNMNATEIVQLRGYEDNSLSLSGRLGDPIYNKFSFELRYPISLKQAATIYALTFAEGGASFTNFKSYNPFAMKRSAGVGLRVFMPAFGLLGFDLGYGFDTLPGALKNSGWQTHFVIGQQF